MPDERVVVDVDDLRPVTVPDVLAESTPLADICLDDFDTLPDVVEVPSTLADVGEAFDIDATVGVKGSGIASLLVSFSRSRSFWSAALIACAS